MKGLITAFVGMVLLTAVIAALAEPKAGMSASLVEPEKNGARGWATVAVTVSGVTLTDPATAKEVPKPGQAHLHYQIDDGPIVATIAPKLSFHELKPGDHKVVVMLVGNDHAPLGPMETLSIRATQHAAH
jgi:hypothetical protein